MKKIITLLKRILLSFFMLYGYNILVPSKALIPINIFTVIILTFFDVFGLIYLIILKLFVF